MTRDSPQVSRAPAGPAVCRGVVVAIAALVLALGLAPARAGAQAPVEAYGAADGGGFHDVLATTQPLMFRDLMYAPGVTTADLGTYFADATFGTKPEDVARTYSPRPDVTIVRDANGIPHVYGATRDGAMFGLGYAAAEDRLFAMDVLRYAGRAALSSFLGGAGQGADAAQWRYAPYSEADLTRQVDQLPRLLGFRGQMLLRDVGSYVEGINDYLARVRADPSLLPSQYAAIGRRAAPAPWTTADVVAAAAVVTRALGPDSGGELARAALRRALVARFGRRGGLRVLAEVLGAAPRKVRRGTQVLPERGAVVPEATASPAPPPAAPRGGGAQPANGAGALLVSRAASRDGRPIMVAGPQLGDPVAGALMEEDVHAPAGPGVTGVDARGAAIAGLGPYVAFGHGRDYAWSAAPGGMDSTDTFVLPLCDPSGAPADMTSTAYLFRGQCVRMEELTRTNRWAPNASDATPAGAQVLRAERTELGIVVDRGVIDGRPVAVTSLRATYLHELEFTTALQALDEPASVRSPRTFARAVYRVGVPSRWFYVDERHTATFTAGADPLRARGADPSMPMAASAPWRGWDPVTWTSRRRARTAHPRAVDRRTIATAAFAGTLRRAVRRHRRIRLAHAVGLMETAGTADPRARAALGDALKVVGRPRSRSVRRAARELRSWLRAGALRRDRNGDGVYEHADAIRVMDAWWPLLAREQFAAKLGPDVFAALRSAVGGSWTGVVRRDLTALLHHHRALCGGGRRRVCRHALLRALGTAAATPGTLLYPGSSSCVAGDQKCHDAIALAGQRLPFIDRPPYQQAVSVRRRVTPPSSSCGGVRHALPSSPPTAPPPLLIGDSVVLGALPDAAGAGFEVDARACRGFNEGLEVLRLRADTTKLPHLVVLQLGTDGSVKPKQLRRALAIVGRRRLLGLVTPREIFGHDTSDAKAMRAAARAHPRRILLLDWARYSRDHDSWFGPDEVHLSVEGARQFGAFLAQGVAGVVAARKGP